MIGDLGYPIDLEGAGFIILKSTKIFYTNQAGGYSCSHPVDEGFFIPSIFNFDLIQDHFASRDGLYGGWCNSGNFKEESAKFIDSFFNFNMNQIKFTVDKSRLKESMEAWIYGFYFGYPCVFIFENSD